MTHRSLTQSEIRQLEAQGCSAEDWYRVLVQEPFLVERVVASQFSGDIRLGRFDAVSALPGGPALPCGVYHARLQNTHLGERCRIADVGVLAHYRVADEVLIQQVGALQVTGDTTFGNGTEIEVLNEAGGRGLPLCDELSAQLAYLIVCYRHQGELVARLCRLIQDRAAKRRANVGSIGTGVRICHVGVVSNVLVGDYACIDGAVRLEEGTIRSCREAPVLVGSGVIADHFIFQFGSCVSQGAIVDRCLVGQHVRIGKQFSAQNSVFCCNSELYHGEACSVFAGPYTVSHHKSTLLIAGLFSFYNAGSGTNQSNHMYKLGPVHQGVLERGCKTGSFSYLLWPSRVGAFSNVLGKHSGHFDTSDLPFSVISEREGRSVCMPGMNLFTVGTRRDGAKWPARDGRTDPVRLDQVHFAVWSPYVIGRMLRGRDRLEQLAADARPGQDTLNFSGISVQRLLLHNASRHYELAIRLFIGNCLVGKLEAMAERKTLAEVRAALAADVAPELYAWHDLAGLLAPEPVVAALVADVLTGDIADLAAFQQRCRQLHADYERQEWAWCARLIETRTGEPLTTIGAARLAELVEQWREAVVKTNNMVLQDAGREFDVDMRLGYGLAGDRELRDADFEAVRGTHADNAFVRDVREESERAGRRAEQALALLSGLA